MSSKVEKKAVGNRISLANKKNQREIFLSKRRERGEIFRPIERNQSENTVRKKIEASVGRGKEDDHRAGLAVEGKGERPPIPWN